MRLVEALLERLKHEPWSMYRANGLGGPQWFGWSADSERLAALLDGQLLQTKATGQTRASLSDSERCPRPVLRESTTVVSSRDTQAMTALFAAIG